MGHKKAIVLGGTVPHIELINQLKERGYYTILVDYYPNPPAKSKANLHIQESTLDKDKVLEIAKNYEVELVISTCIDHANVTACYVGEKLGLPIPYTYNTALNVTDKARMKKILIENGIKTARYIIVEDVQNLDEIGLNYPLIVKPTDSVSSKGVTRVNSPEDLKTSVEIAISISKKKSAVIEEFIEGNEIGIDSFIKKGEAVILTTKTRRKINTENVKAQQIYGCFWPSDIATYDDIRYESVATNIARAFGLNNTPLMIQAIERDGEVFVLEFGARIGGGESFRLIKAISGVNYIGKAIDSFLGISVEINPKKPVNYYSENFIYTTDGEFRNISFDQKLIDSGIIEYLDEYKLRGTTISKEMTSNNRVGVFTVKAQSKKGLIDKINNAIKSIEVFDTNGNPIMRKDIYINLIKNLV